MWSLWLCLLFKKAKRFQALFLEDLMASCPNCQHPVAPADDICENCGAVLSTLIPTPAFVAASVATSPSIGAGQAPGTVPPASAPGVCPNCNHPLHAGDDI